MNVGQDTIIIQPKLGHEVYSEKRSEATSSSRQNQTRLGALRIQRKLKMNSDTQQSKFAIHDAAREGQSTC